MPVWFCIPSARPAEKANVTLAKWRERGYKIALWRDSDEDLPICDMYMSGSYPGYARAVNALAQEVLRSDVECDWIVTGGDDTEPDPTHAPADIARECAEHFGGTFGVMQPTGDRYAGGSIDRIAGSPWMGREWCMRANKGAGPFYPDFLHMYSDECLLRAAEKLGVYWRRPDLIHMHHHFMRANDSINSDAVVTEVPTHLVRWNSQAHWDESRALFRRLEAQGFEPCLPL